MDNYSELKESLSLMLMQCDGAVTTDGMGFNRYDAPFARDLARRPEWSPRQAQAVHKMLRKYKTQLEYHGVDFDAIPVPSLKDAPARSSRNDIRKASLNDDRIILSFRLSSRSEFESELAEIRAIPGRQYHENLKAWSVPINNYAIDKIDSMSYEIDPAILKWKEENDKPKAKLDIPQNVKLYPFQEEGVQMLEQLNGRALLADEQGCIDGEAIIFINRGGATKKIKLKDAYLRFNNIAPRESDNWNREITTYTRCDKMGRIGLHPIQNILSKGEKECLYIKTESGKELKLTPDHEVLTKKGWKPIASIKKGDYIFVNGKNICPDCGTDKNIITYKNGSKVITIPQLERVIVKRKIGKRPVYDIIMDDPFRNFIANGIIVHNCGKTCQAICWMKSHPELRPAIIIVPASLKINWTREFKKWGCDEKITVINGTSFPMSMNEKLVVVNYDVIGSYIETFEEMKFKLMVADECFPSGTKINTPTGYKNIEDIKIGDKVFNAIGTGVVTKTFKKESHEMITLFLSNGKEITCTKNHPFFTESGWVKAEHLKNHFLLDSKQIFDLMSYDDRSKIGERNDLRILWKGIGTKGIQNEILREVLLSEMENETTGNKREDIQQECIKKNFKIIKKNIQRKTVDCSSIFRKNEEKQSQFSARSKTENSRILEKIRASNIQNKERREWKGITHSTKDTLVCARKRMGDRISYINREEDEKISDLLQSRYSLSEKENLDRSGWFFTQSIISKRKRQEKRNKVERIRVVGIKIHEQRDNDEFTGSVKKDTTVYNISVSNHPSYYVDGFLVHNCHAIKNSKANRTRAVKYLAKDIPHIICISGTPIINRPIEFYTTLNLLMPKMFNSKNRFIEEYCGGFSEGGKGASNTLRLNEILSKSFMIRRLKKDVLKELPDKQISIIPMEIDNKKEYKRAEEDFIDWLAEKEGDEKAMRAMTAETLVRMEKLKQLSVEGKMEQVIEWIQDILDQDEKLVVFCTHHSAIDKLMETFNDVAVKLDGRSSQADRQKAVDAFQGDEKVRLFVGNIKAAGTGITLTAASIAAFVEIAWTPGEHDQAMDRIHRIGQKESCNIYYLVGMDTIEDDMALLLDNKRRVLTAILNGEAPEDQSLVWELIQQYRNKNMNTKRRV